MNTRARAFARLIPGCDKNIIYPFFSKATKNNSEDCENTRKNEGYSI